MMKNEPTTSPTPEDYSLLAPDKYRLDEEWVMQPKLRMQYGAQEADARRKLAEAKAALEVVEAELKLAIRTDPQAYGLEKITEDAVKTAVPFQKVYKRARAALIEAQHEVDILDAAVAAVDHRKKALEDLVQLFLASYYSSPKAKGENAREKMEQVEQQHLRQRGRTERAR